MKSSWSNNMSTTTTSSTGRSNSNNEENSTHNNIRRTNDEGYVQNHEQIQLPGINNNNHNNNYSINSTNAIENNLTDYGDQILLIEEDSSSESTTYSISSKFSISSFKCLRNLRRSVSEKFQPKFAHSEISEDMKLKQRWILLIFIFVATLIVLFCTFLFKRNNPSYELGLTVNLEQLTERAKCPACFGVTICPLILTEHIYLNDWNKFSLSKFANAKNIFYATWNDEGVDKQVVLKKLAHDNELAELDKAICDRHGKNHQCDVRSAVMSLINKYSHKPSHLTADDPIILHGEKIGTASDILLCPSHRKMEFLIDAHKKFARGQHHNTILANVLTTMLVNPEPLLLQAFPSSQGWPFPAYYGGCGRIVAEEYVGRRLTTYYKEPFVTRAYIAKQLLEIANKFNQNPSNFILYLTDITPDNFAVEENTNIVKVVDLENIIMVDKETLIQSKVPGHDKLLVGESVFCKDNGNAENMCFSFSTDDLCDKPRTDHNYYAICAGLLAPSPLSDEFPDGLLHSAPTELKDYTKFSQILEICKNPQNATQSSDELHLHDRIEAGQTLIELLGNYLKQFKSKR